eukprot:scaffold878_cov271-Pinguiococcus_pyrenoidosus.AAC.5
MASPALNAQATSRMFPSSRTRPAITWRTSHSWDPDSNWASGAGDGEGVANVLPRESRVGEVERQVHFHANFMYVRHDPEQWHALIKQSYRVFKYKAVADFEIDLDVVRDSIPAGILRVEYAPA